MHEMRADEAGAAGNEYAHEPQSTAALLGMFGSKAAQAGAQGLPPVRQLRSALLRPQPRVRGARRGGRDLRGRDAANARLEACLLEDRLREVGPRAVSPRRHVVDAVREVDHLLRRLCEMPDVRRRATLVVD